MRLEYARSGTELFANAASALVQHGVTVQRRGHDCIEIPEPVTLAMSDPSSFLCLHPARRLNPWVALAEFPWLMAGRNDVAWLLPYLPRAAQFSDDGLRWRAGYGPRMRAWPAIVGGADGPGHDQLGECVRRLRADPSTRQAIISFWDPARDNVIGSRDYPCTQTVHFQASQGALDCVVHIRSNDAVWGMSGVNVPNFCLLQMWVAQRVGMSVGRYFHIADNLHFYRRHERMMNLAARWSHRSLGEVPIRRGPRFHDDPDVEYFAEALALVSHLRQRHLAKVDIDHIAGQLDVSASDYVAQWVTFMLVHDMVTKTPRRQVLEETKGRLVREVSSVLSVIRHPDWRFAAWAWILRNEGTDQRLRDAAGSYLKARIDPHARAAWWGRWMVDVA